jgi:holo-[acyl-carrier protein] synthase
MVYGIGTDVCDVRRIAATLGRKGDRFAEKVLGPAEIEVFRARRASRPRRRSPRRSAWACTCP